MRAFLSVPPGPAGVTPRERLRLMRRVGIAMLLAGAVTCVGNLFITAMPTFSQVVQAGCALAFVLWAIVLVVTRPHPRLIVAVVFSAILIISVLMSSSDPIGMGPFFYLWPVVYAAYFLSRRQLVACYLLMVVTLAAALALNTHHDLKLDTFTSTVASVGVMAALVSSMNERDARLRGELARVAETDALTDVLNRRAFNPELATMIARAEATGSPLAVVMFDLDYFKRFNDRHGHLAGDAALRRVAEVLREQSRDGDAVCRFGGEEFAVALPGAGITVARAYTERVARALWWGENSSGLPVSTSSGIAVLAPDVSGAGDLLARADEALYAAKKAGRSRTAWWDDTIQVGPSFLDTAVDLRRPVPSPPEVAAGQMLWP